MKIFKKLFAFFLFTTICFSSWCQNINNSKGPCTDSIAQNTKGRWINRLDNSTSVSSFQKQEAYKQIDVLHNILLKIFPQPIGLDVRVFRSASPGYFGATRKYRFTEDDVLTFDYQKKLLITSYSYFANFSPHYCAHTDKGIVFMTGNQNENSDGVGLNVNDFASLMDGPSADDDWTINGLPVRRRIPVTNEKWKGFEVFGDVRGRGRLILLHRKGILPYLPVTRKQYLDRCITYTTQLHDKVIESLKQIPVRSPEEQEKEKKAKLEKFEKNFGKDPKRLKSAVDYYLSGYKTDQQIRDEQVANAKKIKETELKIFADEMEKTTREGLLDSAAVILVMYYSTPYVFESDPLKGYMLVTENPDYIQKDIAGHLPQFMVFNWKWNPDFWPVHKGYEKLFLQDFPIDKLQIMIR